MSNEVKIPNHVAIILDGNGRWAKKRGLSRSLGHKEGFKRLKKLSKHIFKRGVKILSVFAFSTENFKRDKEEVDYLMNLVVRTNLREDVVKAIEEIEESTKDNKSHIFNICFNYGGKMDIVNATKKIVDDVLNNKLDINELNENNYINYLYNSIPDIDLLIRTSGEERISNFMLFQSAYAEMYFSETLFPDFDNKEFDNALKVYSSRDRRFGGIKKY